MNDSIATAAGGLARAVRAHREARGWSLGALARETGLSKTLLSTLESGTGNPSLETMWRLARAYDITLGSLLGEDEPPEVRLIRAGDGSTVTSEGGLVARLVLAEGRSHRTEVYEADLHAGVDYVSLHAPGTEELVYCVEGSLRVGPRGREAELSVGDALWFPGDLPHRYASRDGARVLSIMSYPPVRRSRVEVDR
jgi:XRE family transcriptional regulator, regulator of sulfur utilization